MSYYLSTATPCWDSRYISCLIFRFYRHSYNTQSMVHILTSRQWKTRIHAQTGLNLILSITGLIQVKLTNKSQSMPLRTSSMWNVHITQWPYFGGPLEKPPMISKSSSKSRLEVKRSAELLPGSREVGVSCSMVCMSDITEWLVPLSRVCGKKA